jgi:hypothetical protein
MFETKKYSTISYASFFAGTFHRYKIFVRSLQTKETKKKLLVKLIIT